MPSIVCFGEALIDFLARPPQAPDAPRQFTQYAGGAPANVAVAVAKLGGAAAFIGMLGRDLFGDFLLASLRGAGVNTEHVLRTDAANTALAFVSLDAEGERRFSFYRPPAADLLFRVQDFRPEWFRSAAVFHVCSNSLTEAAIAEATLTGMRQARQAGALVSMDLNLRPSLWPKELDPRPRLWSALVEADLVKLSATELAFLTEPLGGEAAVLAELWRGRPRLLVVTDGPGPMRYCTRTAAGRLDAFSINTVDTTAAGDAFTAGLLQQLMEAGIHATDLDTLASDTGRMRSVLRFAAACGALTATRHGSFAAVPTLAEVQAFLRQYP